MLVSDSCIVAMTSLAVLTLSGLESAAAQDTVEARLLRLEAIVADQQDRLAEQEAALTRQALRLEYQDAQLRARWQVDPGPTVPLQLGDVQTSQTPPLSRGDLVPLQTLSLDAWRAGQSAQSTEAGFPQDAAPQARADLAAIPEGLAVLSRQGRLSFDLSTDYTRSSTNRLVFRGIEIVPGIQIGVIEASEADRDTLGATVSGRFGVTNRLEADFRVPYVLRRDTVTTVQQRDESVTRTIDLKGDGLGDIEGGLRYQISRGERGRPVFIGGLRVKSNTGEGPFDIPRDEFGIASRLAVGSGFWGVEPSISMLLPSDPAVIFASLSYFAHLPKDIDQVEGDIRIGRVDPGDSIGLSLGFGFAINPRFSFSLGYRHNYILPTSTVLNDITEESDELQVGALLLGLSYRVTDKLTLNGNFEFGVTEDAPDMRFILRVPLSF